ncbi:MAG: 2-oxo acid dehydrogenase subunit [Solirubrobacterales bacterium]|nr:2-oxo acid dehydrogenase subunit [Solirubrobacterales bacterium]
MPEVVMPRLSDSMEEGTILKWLKSDGDEVAPGDELVEIETDKATMTYEADASGTLRILAPEGETLPVGAPIAQLGEGVELAAAVLAEEQVPAAAVAAATGAPAPETVPVRAPAEQPASDANGSGPAASPVARRLARERGIDLAAVQGTGPGGRIVKGDVEAASGGPAAPTEAAAPATPAVPPPPPSTVTESGTAKGDVTVQELTRTQSVIARRMAESKATVPEFTLSAEVDMEAAVALRAQLKAVAGAQGATTPSYNDLVVKACAIALREHPRANGAYRDGRFELYSRVNVGVAVAGGDSLVVPTVFDADQKSLGEIARETRTLAERVRAGAVTPPELSGGTFTVSNLGMFGIQSFTAVINAPQAAILAVGAMTPRPVVRDGEIVARHAMTVTLACDHRILYGAAAAGFLGRIRGLLEQPIALAL